MASLLGSPLRAALTVAALLLSACGGSATTLPARHASTPKSRPKPAPARAPSDTDLLNRLLTVRAKAIQAGDAEALASTSNRRAAGEGSSRG